MTEQTIILMSLITGFCIGVVATLYFKWIIDGDLK